MLQAKVEGSVMSGDTTAVYVHESRFPLRILKHLAKAGPPGAGSQIKRLDPLFRYEANAHEHSPTASTSYGLGAASTSSSTSNNTRVIHSASHAKGKQSTTTALGANNEKHGLQHTHSSGTDNENQHRSEILTFESPIEGLVTEWCAPEGQLLHDP